MYSETIDNYSRKLLIEAYEAKANIQKELKLKQMDGADTLSQCLDLVEKLRETMCDCSGWLESFIDMKQSELFDENAANWAKSTLKSLCRFEFALLDMYREYRPDQDMVGNLIPVRYDGLDGIITIDIEFVMPHKKRTGYRSSSMLSFLLDEAFKAQIGEIPEGLRTDKAYIFIEHHVNGNIGQFRKRDCDNYDTKHLIDLAAQYFLKYGDGPDYVRYGEAVIVDDHSFTRACIVRPDVLSRYIANNEGFFSSFLT